MKISFKSLRKQLRRDMVTIVKSGQIFSFYKARGVPTHPSSKNEDHPVHC